MNDFFNIKKGETINFNCFTKVLRVEKGVIYIFHENNKVTDSCFVEMSDNLFVETKSTNRVDLR